MDFSKVTTVLGLSGILCLVASTLYAATLNSDQKSHWYFDLGAGKSYDYAHSNSTLMETVSTGMTFETTASYSIPFFVAGIWLSRIPGFSVVT